jgi:hypothetical protein
MQFSDLTLEDYTNAGLAKPELLALIVKKCQPRTEWELLNISQLIMTYLHETDYEIEQYTFLDILNVLATFHKVKQNRSAPSSKDPIVNENEYKSGVMLVRSPLASAAMNGRYEMLFVSRPIVPIVAAELDSQNNNNETSSVDSSASDDSDAEKPLLDDSKSPSSSSCDDKSSMEPFALRNPCPFYYSNVDCYKLNCVCDVSVNQPKTFVEATRDVLEFVYQYAPLGIIGPKLIKATRYYNPMIGMISKDHPLHRRNYDYSPQAQMQEEVQYAASAFECLTTQVNYQLGGVFYAKNVSSLRAMKKTDWFGYFPIPNSQPLISWLIGAGKHTDWIKEESKISKLIIPLQKFRTSDWMNIVVYGTELKQIIACFKILLWFVDNEQRKAEYHKSLIQGVVRQIALSVL